MNQEFNEFYFPLEGEWVVLCGGFTKEDSHSWDRKSQRYAYDFVKLNSNGKRYSNSMYCLENHYSYLQTVKSPMDGVVVSTRNNMRDNKVLKKKFCSLIFGLGNFIIIKHGHKLYSTMAHLHYGSISYKVGDFVKAKDPVGLVGNSGNSNYPHLHFQIQDKGTLILANSLPITFHDTYNVFSNVSLKSPKIRKNMVVQGDI